MLEIKENEVIKIFISIDERKEYVKDALCISKKDKNRVVNKLRKAIKLSEATDPDKGNIAVIIKALMENGLTGKEIAFFIAEAFYAKIEKCYREQKIKQEAGNAE